jgi:EpsG family
MIYLFVFILVLFLAIRYDFTASGKIDANFWYYFTLVVFIALAGFRYKVGGDTLAYMDYFKDIPFIWQLNKFNFSQAQYEPLWIIFSSLSKSIINDFTLFQILHAIFINIVIFRFIKQNTVYRFTTILIYYLFFYAFFDMEIMRESIAVCIFILGYPYLKQKKWLKFYLYVLLAVLFHTSAIILCIFPFTRNLKFKPLPLMLLASIFVLITILPDAFKTLLTFFIFDERVSTHFTTYASMKLNTHGLLEMLLIYVLVPLFFVYLRNKRLTQKPVFHELYFTYFLLAIISIGFSGFARFIDYLTPMMAIYFAVLLNKIYRDKYYMPFKRILVTSLMLIAFLPKLFYYFTDTSYITYGTKQYDRWYPYCSVFDKKENYKREALYYNYFELN